jgi:DNA-binding response OmpR family regulator
MNRILIAEDEPRIAAFLQEGLKRKGFITRVVEDGNAAIARGKTEEFDVLILDLGLPGKNGIAVIEALRQRGEQLPIIVLTVFQDVRDKVRALEAGANDYVTKPFSLAELIARIRVQLRQQRSADLPEEIVLRVGSLTIDLRRRRVEVKERSVDLSTREFVLLEMLARQPGQTCRREDLLSQVWGYDYDPSSNIVDVYIGYLRRKLGHDSIETVRGVGYRLIYK